MCVFEELSYEYQFIWNMIEKAQLRASAGLE